MRVPAAKSSGSWVQPCSITTSGRARPSKPAGSNSLKTRVPASPVKLLSANRGAVRRSSESAGASRSTMPGRVSASSALAGPGSISRTKPSNTSAAATVAEVGASARAARSTAAAGSFRQGTLDGFGGFDELAAAGQAGGGEEFLEEGIQGRLGIGHGRSVTRRQVLCCSAAITSVAGSSSTQRLRRVATIASTPRPPPAARKGSRDESDLERRHPRGERRHRRRRRQPLLPRSEPEARVHDLQQPPLDVPVEGRRRTTTA